MWAPISTGTPSEEAFIARCLLGPGVVEASRRLSMLDLRVWAALCGLFYEQRPDDGRTIATTGYQLADLVFANDGGNKYVQLKISLHRLFRVIATVRAVEDHPDIDAKTFHQGEVHLIGAVWSATTELSLREPHQWGALKGTTSLRIELGTWPAQQVLAGSCTWLDLDMMRALGTGLAARVWVALEAWARWPQRSLDERTEVCSIGLGEPALNSLGVGGYARRVDARKALVAAGRKIASVDPAYGQITVEERIGYQLVAHRVRGAKARAEARRNAPEILRVREAVRSNLRG